MHRFKVGQKVVALRDHSLRIYLKDQVYTVESLTCCPQCGIKCLVLEEINLMLGNTCTECGIITIGRSNWNESSFAPLQNNADAIEYRLNVSIKELEVKEYQNQ